MSQWNKSDISYKTHCRNVTFPSMIYYYDCYSVPVYNGTELFDLFD